MPCQTGITAGAEYSGVGDTSTISMTNMGSYGIMDRSEVRKSGITVGAEYAGPSMDHSVPYSSIAPSSINAGKIIFSLKSALCI